MWGETVKGVGLPERLGFNPQGSVCVREAETERGEERERKRETESVRHRERLREMMERRGVEREEGE